MTELLTVKETAARLKVRPKTVREWLKLGKLAGAKAGKSWRIPAEAISGFLQRPLRVLAAADQADIEAAREALADPERIPYEQARRELGL